MTRWSLRRAAPYIFIAPFTLLFVIFWLGPIVTSLWYSLTNWTLTSKGIEFIGIQNYLKLFSDPRFVRALPNTVIFWATHTVVMVGLALTAAILIHSTSVRFKGLFRAAIFIPVTISMAVVAIMFEMVFARDSGLLNLLLGALGITGPSWLEDRSTAMASMVIVKAWRAFGYYALILL